MNPAFLNGYLYKQAGNPFVDLGKSIRKKPLDKDRLAKDFEADKRTDPTYLIGGNNPKVPFGGNNPRVPYMKPDEAKIEFGRIPGYSQDTGLLDLEENQRGVYGKNYERERDKASLYNKDNKIGIDMAKGYKGKIPLIDASMFATSGYDTHRDYIRLNTDELSRFARDRAVNGYMYTDFAKKRLKYLHQVLGHEGAHRADISPDKATPSGRLTVDDIKDKPYRNFGGWNEDFKEEDYPNITYPETSPPETVPPLAALQQHLFKTTKRRLESPEEYDVFMQNIDAMPTKARWEYIQKLPSEVQRLINYRDVMRHNGDLDKLKPGGDIRNYTPTGTPHERLKNFDKMNRRMIPAIVQNRMNRGSLPA